MSDTIVWISGATGGIGSALARHAPHKGARIIYIDMKDAEGCDNVRFDLLAPESCYGVDPDFGGQCIWKALPPNPDRAAISFDGSVDETTTK